MGKMLKAFKGSFVKHKRYIAYKYMQKDDNLIISFDKSIYLKVQKEIEAILGVKKKYSVDDAIFYFQTKYLAYRVTWEKAWWYEDYSNEYDFDKVTSRDADEMSPFDYSMNSKEKSIVLVVDTFFNQAIREKYPNIAKLEKLRGVNYENGKTHTCNPIIVIGYIKKNVINSMCLANSFCMSSYYRNMDNDIIDQEGVIPDIDYEFWFFHEHC